MAFTGILLRTEFTLGLYSRATAHNGFISRKLVTNRINFKSNRLSNRSRAPLR